MIAPHPPIGLQWMINSDLPDVVAIEAASFERPWDEDEFRRTLRQKDVIGMAAHRDGRVVGFAVYRLRPDRVEILDLAVAPDCRRQGVGRRMLSRLASKLEGSTRTHLAINCPDSHLAGHLFLRSRGFRAVSVLARADGPDLYRFRYDLPLDDRLPGGEAA